MRTANLLATLACGLAVALLAAPAPAAAAVLPAPPIVDMQPASDAMPVAFSFTHAAPGDGEAHRSRPIAAPAPRAGWQPRWFGYPTANAEEVPASPAPPAPAMLFAHASLGVATLDAPADTGGAVAVAGAGRLSPGHLSPGQLRLTTSPAPASGFPSPLPIALILALVLLPVGLVLGQALRGPPRRPVPAMRRPVVSRRTDED
jgi:hypothetical protein